MPVKTYDYEITYDTQVTVSFLGVPEVHPEAKLVILRILEDKDCGTKLQDMEDDGVETSVIAMLAEMRDRGQETWEEITEWVEENL